MEYSLHCCTEFDRFRKELGAIWGHRESTLGQFDENIPKIRGTEYSMFGSNPVKKYKNKFIIVLEWQLTLK